MGRKRASGAGAEGGGVGPGAGEVLRGHVQAEQHRAGARQGSPT